MTIPAPPQRPANRRGKNRIIITIILLLVFSPILTMAFMIWREFSQTANRVHCASNMRQIGQALLAYANNNRGRYPPDLGALLKIQSTPITDFLCPSMPHGESPPSNYTQLTPDQQAQWVIQHTDFVYLGADHVEGEDPKIIILYEKNTERNSAPTSPSAQSTSKSFTWTATSNRSPPPKPIAKS